VRDSDRLEPVHETPAGVRSRVGLRPDREPFHRAVVNLHGRWRRLGTFASLEDALQLVHLYGERDRLGTSVLRCAGSSATSQKARRAFNTSLRSRRISQGSSVERRGGTTNLKKRVEPSVSHAPRRGDGATRADTDTARREGRARFAPVGRRGGGMAAAATPPSRVRPLVLLVPTCAYSV